MAASLERKGPRLQERNKKRLVYKRSDIQIRGTGERVAAASIQYPTEKQLTYAAVYKKRKEEYSLQSSLVCVKSPVAYTVIGERMGLSS